MVEAAQNGDLEMMQFLFNRDSRVDYPEGDLRRASFVGSVVSDDMRRASDYILPVDLKIRAIELLIQNGADINSGYDTQLNSVRAAIHNIAKASKEKDKQIRKAKIKDNFSLLSWLIEHGADPQAQVEMIRQRIGKTPQGSFREILRKGLTIEGFVESEFRVNELRGEALLLRDRILLTLKK